jgi:sarcosine oxidase
MPAMTNTADIIVIGLGAMGSATLYQAAKLGASVIGIDRFSPPHDRGSSHGDTRITREAIGEGREFVPLVQRSNRIWEELEAATGRSLLTRCGALILTSQSISGDHHGSSSFVGDTIATAKEFGVTHEILDAEEIRRRYPQFKLSGDEVGYFEPGAGFLRPEACVETQLALARQRGAKFLTSETVLDVRENNGSVEVNTDKAIYTAARAIVTAGPWIQKLLGTQYERYFSIYRQVLCWFALAKNAEQYSPARFPVFIWIVGNRPRDMLYGFPAIDGPTGGLKIATEQYEATVDPDTVMRTVGESETDTMYHEYIAPRFPDVSGECLRAVTCLYTVTPDAKFIIDAVRDCESVQFASPCSGHGFKHSAAIGEALAAWALRRASRVDLSAFRLDRFANRNSGTVTAEA